MGPAATLQAPKASVWLLKRAMRPHRGRFLELWVEFGPPRPLTSSVHGMVEISANLKPRGGRDSLGVEEKLPEASSLGDGLEVSWIC